MAIAPWNSDAILVALWNESRVIVVDRTDESRPAGVEDFLTEIDRPQFLLADGDRLLVVDFGQGRVLAVQAA